LKWKVKKRESWSCLRLMIVGGDLQLIVFRSIIDGQNDFGTSLWHLLHV
jgi:hypothetical protein